MRTLIRVLIVIFALCLLALAFLLGRAEVQREVVCPTQLYICNCGDVSVDCCCPTEVVVETATFTPSATPTDAPTLAPTQTVRPTATHTRRATPLPTVTDAPPTATPIVPYTPTVTYQPTETSSPIPTATPRPSHTPTLELVFCHCEQGEGEGAEGRKNCHPTRYTHGHSQHEWDYWSTDGTCDGWHH